MRYIYHLNVTYMYYEIKNHGLSEVLILCLVSDVLNNHRSVRLYTGDLQYSRMLVFG